MIGSLLRRCNPLLSSSTIRSTKCMSSMSLANKRNFFVMDEQTKEETLTEINKFKSEIPSKWPNFVKSVSSTFPYSVLMQEYFYLANQLTTSLGFTDENTMGMAAICRDEITEGCIEQVVRYWGKTFNCCSLSGFITIGKTGLGAATAHCPIDEEDGKRRFVFVGMPHIAISRNGEIGKCKREGIDQESHACGALDAIVNELKNGQLNLELNTNDIEQSILRQRILSEMTYGNKPTLDEITKIASNIIKTDALNLLQNNLDSNTFEYIIFTGIQIHGPDDVDWVYQNEIIHCSNQYENGQKTLYLPVKLDE